MGGIVRSACGRPRLGVDTIFRVMAMANPPDFICCTALWPAIPDEEQVRAFHDWINGELGVEVDPLTFFGSSICDHTRVLEFVRFYFEHTDLHPYFHGELAELVWDSLDQAYWEREPSEEEVDAAKRVVEDAVNNDYFLQNFIVHLSRCDTLNGYALTPWLLSLDRIDAAWLEEEASRFRNGTQPPVDEWRPHP